MRLDGFLAEHRAEVVTLCRAKALTRTSPRPSEAELDEGIPLFIELLIASLRERSATSDQRDAAARHGGELMVRGFTVAQVVHAYGDVCQSVTELAIARAAPISNEDFQTLNGCLDDAIADAVTEFSRLRDESLISAGNERLGVFAHEVRNLLSAATLSYDALKSGLVAVRGATATVLERSLTRLTGLVARSLAEVRLEAGNVRREPVDVCRVMEEIEIVATLNARAQGVVFEAVLPGPHVIIVGDPQILSAILVNLVQNAIKFTPRDGRVVMRGHATDEQVEVSVLDQCGGLGPDASSLFRPFEQRGSDQSGLGLGLTIAHRGAATLDGKIHVEDVPGRGCVFTLVMPRATTTTAAS